MKYTIHIPLLPLPEGEESGEIHTKTAIRPAHRVWLESRSLYPRDIMVNSHKLQYSLQITYPLFELSFPPASLSVSLSLSLQGHVHGRLITPHSLLSLSSFPIQSPPPSSLSHPLTPHSHTSQSLQFLNFPTHPNIETRPNSVQQQRGIATTRFQIRCIGLQAQILRSSRHGRREFSRLCPR